MPEYQVIGGRVVARGPTGTGTLEGLIADLQGIKAALALKAEKTELPEVLDVLDSERTDAALSAAQGKTLKTMIDAVPVTEIVNNLSAGGTDKALSAAMGKKLNQAIAKKLSQDDVLDVLDSDRTDAALSAKQGKALRQTLAAKADLVDGKVPLSQLPPGGAGPSVEVIDALDSNRADAALSAAQGKALKGLIDTIPKTEVVDSLDSDKTDAALSAKQGKTLDALIGEVKARVPETFFGMIKDISVPGVGAKFSLPGKPTDAWFVRVFFSESVIPVASPIALTVPIRLFRNLKASLDGNSNLVGAGMLIRGGTTIFAFQLSAMGLCSQNDLNTPKSVIFLGQKVNLT